jgi:small subunit ribosomal protein S20
MLKKSIMPHPSSLPRRERDACLLQAGSEGAERSSILATHLSAIKRARQNEERRRRNLHIKTNVKSSIKKVRMAIERKDIEGAQKALLKAIPLIQKAHSKGVFHKKTSGRKTSRLTREANALSA